MAINNLTELVELLKQDPTLAAEQVSRDGTSVTNLRVNPIASGLNSSVTTATVTADTTGLTPVQEITDDLLLTQITDVSDQVISNEQLLTDLNGRLTVVEGAISGIVDIVDIAGEIALKANIQDPIFFGTVITDSITIDNNVISTNITNASLELEASGTGQILAKSNLTVGFGGNLVVTSGNTFLNTLIPYTTSGVNIQGSTSFTAGVVNFQTVSQTIVPLTGATGVVTHNLSNGAVFFHSSISANFTANFTNVPTTDDRGIGVALILNQGATPYLPTALQINSSSVTIKWGDASVPGSGNANQVDIVSFTFVRTSSAWTALATLTTFG